MYHVIPDHVNRDKSYIKTTLTLNRILQIADHKLFLRHYEPLAKLLYNYISSYNLLLNSYQDFNRPTTYATQCKRHYIT
jgi:hypothetical protein